MENIDELKQKLLTEQKLLHRQLTELGVQNLQVPTDWIATPDDPVTPLADENEAADRSEEWAAERGEMAALETRYNNVMRALGKIEAGTYGICEVSGEQIEADRLAANPAARTNKARLGDEASLA